MLSDADADADADAGAGADANFLFVGVLFSLQAFFTIKYAWLTAYARRNPRVDTRATS